MRKREWGSELSVGKILWCTKAHVFLIFFNLFFIFYDYYEPCGLVDVQDPTDKIVFIEIYSNYYLW